MTVDGLYWDEAGRADVGMIEPGDTVYCICRGADGLFSVSSGVCVDPPVRFIDFGDGGGPMAFEYGNGAAGILPLAPGNLCVCAENLAANEALVDAGMTVHPVSIQEMTVGFGGPNSLCLPLVREDL